MKNVPACAFAAVLFLLPVLSGRGADNRPNILFIMADDHAWQAVSAYGESRQLIQTPNIDRLAREGLRFDRCLVPNSLCGPSRACDHHRRLQPHQRLLQQFQLPLRRLPNHLPQTAPKRRLPDRR